MVLKGKIIAVLHSKNHFSVIKIQDDGGDSHKASGWIMNPQIGMHIEATGSFVVHPKYGEQFKVEACSLTIEKTESAAYRYLSSGFISGVNVVLARRIVDHFGANVVEDIIEKDPMRLCEIKGISEKKAAKIARSHSENFVYQKLAAFGLSMSQIHKLYDEYGQDAVSVLEKTPYKPIYDVEGFGFKTVDTIARKTGIAIDDPQRIAAAITFSLLEIGALGHCWCHIDNFADRIKTIIPEVDDEKIAAQIIKEFDNGRIIRDGDRVYAAALYYAEISTANGIAHMYTASENMKANGALPLSINQIDRAIREMEFEKGFELEMHQKKAIHCALSNRVSVITGGPGTGKSTIACAIAKGWMQQFPYCADPNKHIVLCAPTGRAARRASELTGVVGETIQRILARRAYEDAEEPLLFILDEASMMDIRLASRLISLVQKKHYLVLIGDVDQLPPIGPGHFFRDCVQSPFVPTSHLTLCHRQKGKIAINAKRINDGLGFHSLNFDDPSCRFVYAEKEDVQKAVVTEYMKLLDKGYSVRDICCITPIRKSGKSETSADDLNKIIREKLNPVTEHSFLSDPNKLRVGDRVMNTENDYDAQVFNGDCGVICDLNEATGTTTVIMDDGRMIEFNRHTATFLTLAYATSVHKAQGSEYKAVVVAHSKEHYFMLQRNLLYTAVTRAREELVIVGENAAIDMAVGKIPSLERNTSLKERIKDAVIHST